jgi:phosphoglucomutase
MKEVSVHPLAGEPAPRSVLVDVAKLVTAYSTQRPDPSVPEEQVSFGTSGHRGSSLNASFNEAHILAITQAICEYRRQHGVDGPLFLGRDTHALSEPAFASALEVLSASGVDVAIDAAGGYTPTPAVSHAILTHNRGREFGLSDGIIITPSHNPPEDGGFKYNPPHGGPAESAVTTWIEKRANELLEKETASLPRWPLERALAADTTHRFDFITPYVSGLDRVIDMEAIRSAGLKIGVDPMGGAGVAYWGPIAERFGLDLEVVNPNVDPTFAFMTLDRDGRIRMDCSSPYAMASLVRLKDRFDIAFGNDTDYDRHGIVTPSSGLLSPNAYLAVAIDYLFRHRPDWPPDAAVGKTLVSSSLIDRVAGRLGRRLAEVPVGFKWFVDGLRDSRYGFAGEESAGASFLRFDGSVWTTEKDGPILDLLAAEITARMGRDPGERYNELARELGEPLYERSEAPATAEQKGVLTRLSADQIASSELAGEKIEAKLTTAPENGAAIGGLKIVARNGWFAARPSGTEDVYKIYAESFLGPAHLERIQEQARSIVGAAFADAGVS